ncbi:nuclear transport factor 2 family protein [Pinirhizobacter soli]|uniref:nuclear transport factor 2 family protein n=1 Tax=Pinirhizobacter soli TaxID=2786953 RepID=UPI00202A593E|nr:nuclear transport factor 2 family protein [Pinirhizobacter soli]
MNLSKSILGTAMTLVLALPAAAIAASAPAAEPGISAEAANIQTARSLYAAIFTARDIAVASRYLGPEYIQHATDVADGKEGLARAIAEIAAQTPQISYEIKHIIAEGNLVTLMSHLRPTPDARGQMLFNIFRFDGGKIVEHWETVQDIPETSANGNGVF